MCRGVFFVLLLSAIFSLSEEVFSKEIKYSKDQIIPRSALLAKPDRFCVSMNFAGDKIAYLSRKNSEIALCIEEVSSGKLLKEIPVKPSRGLLLQGPIWTHSGTHILIFQDKNGDENDHVFCFNINTGKSKDLTPFSDAKSTVERISKKHPNEIIIGCNKNDPKWFDAYRINIVTGENRMIFRNNEYGRLIFDSNLNLRLANKTVSDGSEEWFVFEDSRAKLFKKIPFEDTKNSTFLYFNANCKKLYGLDSFGRDKSSLVEYDFDSKTSKVLFESDLADVGLFSFDPNTFAPQAVTVDYLKQNIFTIDSAISEDIRFLKAHSNGNEIDIISRNSSDDRWVVAFHSSSSPTKYYLYSRCAQKHEPISLKILFSSHPQLDKYQLQEKEPLVIKSRDGLELVCYLTKSFDFKDGVPSKFILNIHGGPWARDGFFLDKEVQLLANRGYSVLQINYRGSTGFGKSFINAANKNLDKIRDDIVDAANWAIANKIADKNKIAIMGGSFGGYSALAGLAFNPEIFTCGVDIVGPSNWVTVLKTVPKYWLPHMAGWYRLAGDPRTEAGRDLLLSNSPITKVNNIRKPLIIFQGEHDPRVNKAESDQMVKALKEKGLKVAYILYPDEGHGFLRESNRKSYLAITEKFLAKILGGWFEPIQEKELEGSSHQILEGKELLDGLQ